LDRLQKTAGDTVKHNLHKVQCEVLTDSGRTLEDSCGESDTEPRDGRV